MPRAIGVGVTFHIKQENINRLNAFMADIQLNVVNPSMIAEIARDAIEKVYKERVLELTPKPMEEKYYRYAGQSISGKISEKGIDPRRYIQGKGQMSLREAIRREKPYVIEAGKSKFRVAWASFRRLNQKTIFGWRYSLRTTANPKHWPITTRWLDEDTVDTVEKFEYGGTWIITPRPPEGNEIMPHGLYPFGEKAVAKTIPAFGMFSNATRDTRGKIVEYVRRAIKARLRNRRK